MSIEKSDKEMIRLLNQIKEEIKEDEFNPDEELEVLDSILRIEPNLEVRDRIAKLYHFVEIIKKYYEEVK